MSQSPEPIAIKPPRLKFIDMARSLAILMMLEGHFTGAALAMEYRTYDYTAYKIWHNIHGLTTPLFFTLTGLIFVYLLIGGKKTDFRSNIRVQKGLRRVLQLLFWGYFIQLNLKSIFNSLINGTKLHLDWFFAFHVLQSIGIGLLIVISVYILYSWINRGSIILYYLITSIILFIFYGLLKEYMNIDTKAIQMAAEQGLNQAPDYWPRNAPAIIQNMFYGKYSDFSFIRMSTYVLLGAMLGAIIKTYEQHVKKLWFGLALIVIGIIISVYAVNIMRSFDSFFAWTNLTSKGTLVHGYIPLSRYGQVVIILGVLSLIDKYFVIKNSLFIKIGQNTFAIYVVHAIILYNGIFGLGLQPHVFDKNLDPYTSIAISIGAITFFFIMVKYIEPLEKIYNEFLYLIRVKKRKEI